MAKPIKDSLLVDGSVTATTFAGSGSGLTDIAQTSTLTGLVIAGGTVAATDTIVQAIGKLASGSGGSDATLVYNQVLPEAIWTINHSLNKYPSVTVVDSANTKVEGDIVYPSLSQVVITFSGAFSGRAFLN